MAEKEAQRQVEEAKLAAEKEAIRQAGEAKLAAEKEAIRQAEEAKLAAEKEAIRQEEAKLLAEKEARHQAEEAKLLAEKEARRQAEDAKLAAEKVAQRQAEEAARAEAAGLAAEAAKREEAAEAAKEAAKAKKAQQEQMLQNQIADVKKHPSFPVFWKHTLESLSDEEQYEFGEHDPEADLAAWEDFLAFEDAKSKKLQEATCPKKATADDLAKQTVLTLGAERSQKEKGMLQETGFLSPEALQRRKGSICGNSSRRPKPGKRLLQRRQRTTLLAGNWAGNQKKSSQKRSNPWGSSRWSREITKPPHQLRHFCRNLTTQEERLPIFWHA